ncbi:unnamed protein product [Kuraishia capsulata CBS 1993]|uniref:SHSP domain-containing protein n=1 Tax=Kuraishia capsulata CBS 1993 TaxID=1382522 RepID=W6MMS8_9ASCO|nr:uncharacterized protein KUCA_T00003476001 [Kuraishia capsulata CBS 1993]CDK27498.1 unnamed protein product [Kuraishia capsulata CBS 1993]
MSVFSNSFFQNDPFWNFFENVNDEVRSVNSLLNRRNRGQAEQQKTVGSVGTPAESSEANSQQVAPTSGKSVARPVAPFRTLFEDPWFGNNSLFGIEPASLTPPVDVVDNEKDYELHVSVAGAKKEGITIDFNKEDNQLIIKGEIPSPVKETEGKKGEVRYSERTTGKFERRVTLPSKLDGENIKAKIEDGVLVLNIPKLAEQPESAKYQRIAIESSESVSS